jgi:hypothetical protein
MGGKEILLKAIIQAIWIFAMGVFKIPKLNDAMDRFWWGDSDEQRRMHWFAWWNICISKKLG